MRTGSDARLFVPRYVRYLTQHRLPRLQGLHITKCPAIWCLSNWRGGAWGGAGKRGRRECQRNNWCVCTYFQTTAMAQGDAWTCLRSCQCHRRLGTNLRDEATPVELVAIQMDAKGGRGGVPTRELRFLFLWEGLALDQGATGHFGRTASDLWTAEIVMGDQSARRAIHYRRKMSERWPALKDCRIMKIKIVTPQRPADRLWTTQTIAEHRRHQSLSIALVWQ